MVEPDSINIVTTASTTKSTTSTYTKTTTDASKGKFFVCTYEKFLPSINLKNSIFLMMS